MRAVRIQKPAREHSPLKPREWVETKEDKEQVRRILAGERFLPRTILDQFETVD